MISTICFVRHGQTEYNINKLIQGQIDNPLSQLGKEDAIIVSQLINNYNLKFDIVISTK